MNVLGIEGALGAFSTAVVIDGTIAAERTETGNVALERGLAAVTSALSRSGLAPHDLDRIAVGTGPGGFTGLRIAIAYAKSLALAWKRPLVAIGSFDVLEYGRELDAVLTVVVGRPGVISARYREGAAVCRASGWTAAVLAEVLPKTLPRDLPVIGAPKDVLAALAERALVVRPLEPLVLPAGAATALAAGACEPSRSIHEVSADYGELPAAKIPKLR